MRNIKLLHILFLIIVAFTIYASSRSDVIYYFEQFVSNDTTGVFVFILLFTAVTVVAPLTAMPLIIPASAIFGPFLTSIYSIVGWVFGAMFAFLIARYFGKPILSFFVSLEKIEKYEAYLSGKVRFLGLVLLRMIMPVDILSYAVGLLSKISLVEYTIATIIGITPFAFIFAYAGDAFISGQYSIFLALSVAAIVIFAAIYFIYRKYRKNTTKKSEI